MSDGMVLIDPEYCTENKKVYAVLLAAFRYGREDLDVLGLTFRKDLILQEQQVRVILISPSIWSDFKSEPENS
jgi:hypothetical protein